MSGSESLIGTAGTSVTHDLSYSYDGMGQLTSASVSNIGGLTYSVSYSYGKDGNIASLTIGTDTVTFKYDSDNDGTDDSDLMTKIGNDSLGWNLNGNLDNSVTASFTYDWDNKLRFAQSGNNSVEIRYDPRGNRIYKAVDDGTNVKERKYIVDIVGRLPVILCEIDPNDSSLKNSYIYANSQILAQNSFTSNEPNNVNFDRYYYLHDRLGSVRQIVDCNALTVATYTYNPYGEDFDTEVSESIYNPFKYAGQWYDAEIAQYYLRARQYDPQLMRFTGHDPAMGRYEEPLTLHRYLYCWNNPVNLVDLNGEAPFSLGSLLGNMVGRAGWGAAGGFVGGILTELGQVLFTDEEWNTGDVMVSMMTGMITGGVSGVMNGLAGAAVPTVKNAMFDLSVGLISGVLSDLYKNSDSAKKMQANIVGSMQVDNMLHVVGINSMVASMY